MQTCSDINVIHPVSSDYIYGRYQLLNFIAKGAEGAVYRVFDRERNEIVALKSRPYSLPNKTKLDAEDLPSEILIGCLLYPTRKYTHSLSIPINWAYIRQPVFDSNWPDDFTDDPDVETVLFTMPLTCLNKESTLYKEWNCITYTDEIADSYYLIRIIFEIFIAVIALRQLGYSHNDIHHGNIMFTRVNYCRLYTINGREYLIKNLVMPILIDFGFAKAFNTTSDLDGLERLFDNWGIIPRVYLDNLKEGNIKEFLFAFERLVTGEARRCKIETHEFDPMTI